MRAAEIDWRYIRGPLIFLVTTLVIGGAVLIASFNFVDSREREYQRERSRLLANRNRYHTLDEEERIIEAYLPRYQELEGSGLIGRERRLNWIETLRDSATTIGLPELRYTIDAQEPVLEPGERNTDRPKVRVYSSKMRLELGLLHEGDLFDLLERLRTGSTGMYIVNRCELRKPNDELDMSGLRSNVAARCELDWLTVRPPPKLEDRT